MREVVEVYRGFEIMRSHLGTESGLPAGYEARYGEWLLVGTLESVRLQIDSRLDREGPGSGIMRIDRPKSSKTA